MLCLIVKLGTNVTADAGLPVQVKSGDLGMA